MKILLLGSGGREHALALKLQGSSAVELVSAPGSDALAELGTCVPLDLEQPASVAAWCAAQRPDLVVVGPEVPLVAGVAAAVRALGIPVFGHAAATARLEGSKAFAKAFMQRHHIPTAASHTVTDLAEGEALIRTGRAQERAARGAGAPQLGRPGAGPDRRDLARHPPECVPPSCP